MEPVYSDPLWAAKKVVLVSWEVVSLLRSISIAHCQALLGQDQVVFVERSSLRFHCIADLPSEMFTVDLLLLFTRDNSHVQGMSLDANVGGV